MKPDEDMHSISEDGTDLDPFDLFVEMGTLIVEGRTLKDLERGYGEGVHCPQAYGTSWHQCDTSSLVCQLYEQRQKHMMLLWKNLIPMSIEVILYPDCCRSVFSKPIVDISILPDTSYILLEQWTVHMYPRRMPDATMVPRSLIQAIRSFLHFSQLSAWLSKTKGKEPRNIYYRVSVPEETFSCKFNSEPDVHVFPAANVGRSGAMKVHLKFRKRSDTIPIVPCERHDKLLKNKDELDANEREIKEYLPEAKSLTPPGSTQDLLLGDSLLDPPQSLERYPKRYQSPSRNRNSSIEAPDYLLCRNVRSHQSRQNMVNSLYKNSIHRAMSASSSLSVPKDNNPYSKASKDLSPKYDSVASPHGTNTAITWLERRSSLPIMVSKLDQEKLVNNNSLEKSLSNLKTSSTPPSAKKSDISDYGHLFIDKFLDISENLNTSELDSSLGEESLSAKEPTHTKFSQSLKGCKLPPEEMENIINSLQHIRHSKGTNKKKYNVPNDHRSGLRNKALTCVQQQTLLLKNSSLCQKKYKSKAESQPKEILIKEDDQENNASQIIPSAESKAQFRRSLDYATSMVFHQNNGLPLTSSPAPIRKSGTCFDFDSSLTTVSAIKKALFEKEPQAEEDVEAEETESHGNSKFPATVSALLGNFEESVLNGRLEPVSTVEGFTAEVGASGSFVPPHLKLTVTVFFYSLQDSQKVNSPYLGHINLGKKGYHVPKAGTIQVTLFNPHRTVIKMFVVRYNLSDMPPNCQTFLRQKTLYMPTDAQEDDPDSRKWLRYLVHLRFISTKSCRIFLHTDIRVIIFYKSDLDAAAIHGERPYELRSFTHGPTNPKFSPLK